MWSTFYYSFPIQLLLLNLKKNQVLLLMWVLLFLIITGNFGGVLGIPYLFLDPEYLNEVSFWSFFIIGIAMGGFTLAFHISCYILDGFRFPFLGTISKPFTNFSINNSIIPLVFFIIYVIKIVSHQQANEINTDWGIFMKILGLTTGNFSMQIVLYTYFWFTNKDIFVILAENVEKRIRKIKITRVTAMHRIKDYKKSTTKVSGYLDLRFRFRKAQTQSGYHFPDTISKVFDQNHLNSVIAELAIFVIIIILGSFRENQFFQIPAAASGILSMTIFMMITGAVSFWFRGWAISISIAGLILFNYVLTSEVLVKKHFAHGLDYSGAVKDYNIREIRRVNSPSNAEEDKKNGLRILENWKMKTGEEKPKLVFVCTSGGGQRAALWTLRVLQEMDSVSESKFFKHVPLITGASGGLIGAAYYRELKLRQLQGESVDPHDYKHLRNISNDMLNPIIFSLLVNDVFIRYQNFSYNGHVYPKDRGYSFEHQLNKNTEGVLNKKIMDYRVPEQNADIPQLLLSPTSINDGRKLYITPQSVTYLSRDYDPSDPFGNYTKLKGIDFMRFFEDQGAENLSFLTALRMSATFPYVTPNVQMPSEPPMKLMDAGLADNFGITDAVRFLHEFKDWISENTSGVVFVSIRDSFKENSIEREPNPTLFQKIFTPISNIYNNWTYIQDIRNDISIEYAKSWFNGPLDLINFEYGVTKNEEQKPNEESEQQYLRELAIKRASLSWRLTSKEKAGIIRAFNERDNQIAAQRLLKLLGE